ncbi:MAG: Crp/Fnr family transcriptional regulator [Betaproteobacteria bacterium]
MDSHAHSLSSPGSPNKILARLPPQEYRRLLPDLVTVRLHQGYAFLRPHIRTQEVYFLSGGVCSIRTVTAEGEMAGVALIGNEGVIGPSAFGGDPESGHTAVLEVADSDAQVMNVSVFRREMERGGAFSQLIYRYAQAFSESLMQSVACNALHSVERRCARCLLEIRDHLGRDEFPFTQEAVAMLLGVRRASVTLAADALHRAGLIEHSHRHIVVRKQLEGAACECYGIIRHYFARLSP